MSIAAQPPMLRRCLRLALRPRAADRPPPTLLRPPRRSESHATQAETAAGPRPPAPSLAVAAPQLEAALVEMRRLRELESALLREAECAYVNLRVPNPPAPQHSPAPPPRTSSFAGSALRRLAAAAGTDSSAAEAAAGWRAQAALLGPQLAQYSQLKPAARCQLIHALRGVVTEARRALSARPDAYCFEPVPPVPPVPAGEVLQTGGQRTAAWHVARDSLLTASQFGAALGLHGERGLLENWEQRTGLAPPFRGNRFTSWGTNTEPEALAAYTLAVRLPPDGVTQQDFVRAAGVGGEPAWLGASPDGLLSDGVGLLELKCPTGGREALTFDEAKPWAAEPPAYYMPQLLGQLAVLERSYAHLFCYTRRHGSALYRLDFDPAAWAAMKAQLHAYWFQSLLPAKQALQQGASPTDVRRQFAPVLDPKAAAAMRAACARLAEAAAASCVRVSSPAAAAVAERRAAMEAAEQTRAKQSAR